MHEHFCVISLQHIYFDFWKSFQVIPPRTYRILFNANIKRKNYWRLRIKWKIQRFNESIILENYFNAYSNNGRNWKILTTPLLMQSHLFLFFASCIRFDEYIYFVYLKSWIHPSKLKVVIKIPKFFIYLFSLHLNVKYFLKIFNQVNLINSTDYKRD